MRLPVVDEVDVALPKVLAVGLGELFTHLLDDLHEHPFDVPVSLLQGGTHLILEVRVVEHEELGLEEGSPLPGDEILHFGGRGRKG